MTWKDCKEWANVGLRLSTTSNEAAKMYDAAVTQYVSGFSEDSVGGMAGAVDKMRAADPNFVLGLAVSNGLKLLGTMTSTWNNAELKHDIESMVQIAKNNNILTWKEKLHVNAVKLFSEGYLREAINTWEDILLRHPTDALALRFAVDSYFFCGKMTQYRDCIARVKPYWESKKVSQSMYGYLKSTYAFGLEETYLFNEAETEARQALELNACDGWATHVIAHVMEMQCRYDEGIHYLKTSVNQYQGDYASALDLYDEIATCRLGSGTRFDILDLVMLLQRLEFEGVDVGNRWKKVYSLCQPHFNDHALVYNDVLYMMVALGAKQDEAAANFLQSIKHFVRSKREDHTIAKAFSDVGISICESLTAYHHGDFADVVDILNPRDIFSILLIQSAIKSTRRDHQRFARSLLNERNAMKTGSPMTDRLLEKLNTMVLAE
ncbi:tetratricopeptide repeat protein 38-like [Saccoglossus kowalevskii]|uniref:Tetratricopeptide repeat protein 38 n=1 Tax=Saccoglossus kowalevskii TaxID=10224 RepID=A0ABM0LU64_SACKO|nr:PREDICTED: tetratricopeptide repeat protein 38-like [Saccoglossus kowalevskii]